MTCATSKFFSISASLVAAVVAMAAVASLAGAGIIANFTDGNGNTAVDQYPGIAGSGWATPWVVSSAFDSGWPTVVSTNPIGGGGNYLTGKKTVTSTSQTRAAVYRQYSTYDNVDLSQPHRISLDLRADTLQDFNEGNNADYLQIFENNTGTDFGSTGTWLIRAYGADNGGAKGWYWALYNGVRDGGAFDPLKFVDTGVPLIVGEVYHFIIDLVPASGDWKATIIYSGGTYVSGTMGYRGNPASVVADYVTIGSSGKRLNTSAPNSIIEWSADNISIVPEPATFALLGLGGALMLLRRKR